MSAKSIDIQDGVFNFSFTEISARKTGVRETDEMNKRFCKETLNFMKNLRSDFKKYIYDLSQILGQDPTTEAYDLGIKYDYQKLKFETSIKCFMNNDLLMDAIGVSNFSLPKEEAEKLGYTEGISNMSDVPDELQKAMAEQKINEFFELIGKPVETDAGLSYSLGDKALEGIDFIEDKEGRNEIIEKVLSKKHIYRYIKALDIFDEAQEEFESEIDYYDALNAAAGAFSEKFENDSIDVRTVIFVNGLSFIMPGENGSKEEFVVDKDYFKDELNKKWYINLREILISPYKSYDAENDVTISMPGEFSASFQFPHTTAEDILECVDKIGEIYTANCEMAEKADEDIEELPVEYCPHIYLDGEMQAIDSIMLLSDDFELIEIPLSPMGTDSPITLTRYYWEEKTE